MKALNAVGLTPISVLSDRRTESRKVVSIPPLKNSSTLNFNTNISRNLQGGVVLLSSVLTSGLANALTYEEALRQSVSDSASDFDPNGVVESVSSFVTDNPILLVGGFAVLAVPLVVSRLFSKPKPWGVETAKTAYAKLSDDSNAQLIDIRPVVEFKQVGSPDIRVLKKKTITVVYKGEDKVGFLSKLAVKFKEPENTTLFILDKFDGNSELVAELVTANGFKAAYGIKDGAEGPRGWLNSGLPWIQPKKTFSLDFNSLVDAVGDALGEGADAATVAIGVAAAAGLSLLAFSEVETILQVLGSAALVQFFTKKFLFAEERQKTLKEFDEFLNTKIDPKEFVDEIKQIGTALLPFTVTSKSLPAPTEASSPAPPTVVAADSTVQKTESIPEPEPVPVPEANNVPLKVEAVTEPEPVPLKIEAVTEPEPEPVPLKVEAVTEPTPEVNSVPKISRPQSPFANYPDLKPPSSPIPSQP